MGKKAGKTKKKLRPVLVFLIVMLVLVMLVTAGVACLVRFALMPVSEDTATVYELHVPNGMTVMEVASKLEEEGIIRSRYFLYAAARYNVFDKDKSFNLKSGAYLLSSSMSLKDIYDILQTGSPENIRVVIPEGLTITKTAAIIEGAGLCGAEDFIAACRSEQLISKYGIPSSTLEGYLFPDTYFFTEGMDVEEIIGKFLDNFVEKAEGIPDLKGISPEKLNEDPYGAWIIKVSGVTETDELLSAAEYEAFCPEA